MAAATGFLTRIAPARPEERRALALAFLCHAVLFASYYILRPLRETMATVFGADELQTLFTGTFLLTLICAPLYSAMAARIRLDRFLPGVFWFWLGNIALFYVLFAYAPHSRWVAAAYYWWFSVVNLFLVSVFWTLMADIFTDGQATRLFPIITAGSSIGAIAGPIITRLLVGPLGVGGLLIIAGGGFLLAILLVYRLMAEKEKLRRHDAEVQQTTLDHNLPGNPFAGFLLLMRSPIMRAQALFILGMTWVATIVYFRQIELVAGAYASIAGRTIAFADVDLVVNAASALIAVFGLSRLVTRLGVTWGLVLSPVLMACVFAGVLLSPGLMMVQSARALQRISQYAIARPAREILFTVADQQSKYKAKNVIDTVGYRFGDLSAAWMQAGLRLAGSGFAGVIGLGVAISALWGVVALVLGRRFEAARKLKA
jgi:AAA family ATP:ADP antiporter